MTPDCRSRTAVVTGVTGQDGVLLARVLRAEGVRVIGTHRPGSPAAADMAPYLAGVELVGLDLRDNDGFSALVKDVRPDEVFNLAAMSSVGQSWKHPEEAVAVNGAAPEAMLAALRFLPEVRFLQAASSEEGAGAADSPYARGKQRAHDAVERARASGQFASAAVLHIHESPLRRRSFVARKITRAAAAIALGVQERLSLGALDISRDWGSAVDYVRAMRAILAAEQPGDFEVATGKLHALRDVVDLAFAAAGVQDPWDRIDVDDALRRPEESLGRPGDPKPLQAALGWSAETSLADTLALMVAVDRRRLESGVEERQQYLSGWSP